MDPEEIRHAPAHTPSTVTLIQGQDPDGAGGQFNLQAFVESVSVGGGGGGKHVSTIGDAAAKTFAINHALDSADITIEVRDTAGGNTLYTSYKVTFTDDDNCTLDFRPITPTTNRFKVIIRS